MPVNPACQLEVSLGPFGSRDTQILTQKKENQVLATFIPRHAVVSRFADVIKNTTGLVSIRWKGRVSEAYKAKKQHQGFTDIMAKEISLLS